MISGTAQLHEESAKVWKRKKPPAGRKKFDTTQLQLWIMSRKSGGIDDTTHGSPDQDPLLSSSSLSKQHTTFHSVFTVN